MSQALFSAHMTQHLILILIAAPLLVASDFPMAFFWAMPRSWAHRFGRAIHRSEILKQVWRAISNPVSAWFLSTIALWIWHAPKLYQAALENEAIHAVEHLTFLVTAMLFWWVLFKHSHQKHVHYGMAILYLFFTAIQSSILSALMTFSSQPWYPYYNDLVKPWGLTPLQDQQLAGLIMWLPGGAVYTLLTIGYFEAWFRALEKRSESKLRFR
jgi:putative membrane protein